MLVHFVFVGEGTSDAGMLPHLETLCIEAGATEVTGVAPDFGRLPLAVGRTVEAKLRAALALEPQANLVFVHRDSDGRDGATRRTEICAAAIASNCHWPVVCVVPVQETEAWLLLDEGAIRRAVGRPRSNEPLGLPVPRDVEDLANPKERLKRALEIASGARGRRLDRLRNDFGFYRRSLLEALPTTGVIQQLPSWAQLRRDLGQALDVITMP